MDGEDEEEWGADERGPEGDEASLGLDSVGVAIKIEKDRTQRCFGFIGKPGRRVSRWRT